MANNTINLKSPSSFTSGFLIGDEVPYPGGSVDSTPTLTKLITGETVSAALEIQSLLGAVLIPRMTTAEMNSLTSCDAMMVYNTDAASPDFYFHVGGTWVAVTTGAAHGVTSLSAGANIVLTPNPIIATGTIALATALTGITSISSPAATSLTLETNAGVAAITIGATQNVAFAQNIFLNANNPAKGLFSFFASTTNGGVFFDSSHGDIRFNGGNSSNIFNVYDSNGLAILQIFNKGTLGPVDINNGTLSVYDNISSGSAGTNQGSLTLKSLGGGSVTHNVQSTATNYTLGWPTSLPPFTGYILSSDNSGNLSWVPNPEDVGGSPNSLAYFNSFGELASNANATVDSSGDIATNGNFQATGSITSGNGSTTGSFVIDSSGGGSVTHTIQTTATNYTMNWPTSDPPSSGYILSSSSIGVLAWIANPQLGGTANTLAYYNSGGTLASNTNVTVHSAGDISTTSTIQAGNILLTGSTVESTSGNSLTLATNGGTTAITMDTGGNATFGASAYLNNSFVINLGKNATSGTTYTPSIILNSSTTNYMQLGANFGGGSFHLIETVGSFPFEIQSGNILEFLTNGSTLALTLDTAQTAIFQGSVSLLSSNNIALAANHGAGTTFTPAVEWFYNNTIFSNITQMSTGLAVGTNTASNNAFTVNSGTSINLNTNGTTNAVTIDTGQNATFTQNIYLSSNSNFRGIYPFLAYTSAGGVYFTSSGGDLVFDGGTTSSTWHIYDSTGLPVFQVVNNGGGGMGGWVSVDNQVIYTQTTMTLSTNGGTSVAAALVLDTSQNATFQGNVSLINSNNIILGSNHGSATTLTPEIQLFYKDALSSTIQQLSTGLAITSSSAANSNITFNSGRSITFETNGGTTALTLSTSQDAHFRGTLEADGFITSGIAGTTTGSFVLNNSGGGNLALSVATSASLYSINFPGSAPSNAGFLNVQNGGTTNWVTGRCAFSNASQSLTGGATNALQFSTTTYNNGGIITVSGTGNTTFTNGSGSTIYVFVTYSVFLLFSSTADAPQTYININGSGTNYAPCTLASLTYPTTVTCSGNGILTLNAGDFFQVLANPGANTVSAGVALLNIWQLA